MEPPIPVSVVLNISVLAILGVYHGVKNLRLATEAQF